MRQGPAPGELDESGLLEAIRRQLSEGLDGVNAGNPNAFYEAGTRAYIEDTRHGNMADLLLHWITGGRSDLATLLQADEILSGSGTDARQQQVVEMVRRLATGQITWEQYASETKKRLIRHRLPKRPPTPPGAIGLVAAARALEQMLVDANAADGALLESVWYVVNAFARLPVSPPEGSFIQDDMCL